MDTEAVKGKPLTKEETKALLELIESSKIINNRTTNATNNKLKTEEWSRIAVRFNASSATVCRRTPQQLRLKWENLKKNARKRSTRIRMNSIQTGGGAGDYIPPDEILERVTSLLGSTANGFEVPFGGDRNVECGVGGDGEGDGSGGEGCSVNSDLIDYYFDPKPSTESVGSTVPVPEVCEVFVVQEDCPIERPKKYMSTPKSGKLKRQADPHPSKVAKDLAIADYFNIKKQCIKGKIENILLCNEKLKLENERLRLEIENLKKGTS